MYAIVLLSILASGYYYTSTHPLLYYKLHRFDGQKLYLDSAINGFGFIFLAFVLIFLIYLGLPEDSFITDLISKITKNPKIFNLLDLFSLSAAILSFVLAILKKHIFIITRKDEILRLNLLAIQNKETFKRIDSGTIETIFKTSLMEEIFKDSPLDILLLTYMSTKKNLMIHLEDRKVYIGIIAKMGEPTENKGLDQEIELYPSFSGYRTADTLEVILTTKYNNLDKIKIVIKQQKIVSATPFNHKSYTNFSYERNIGTRRVPS